MQLSDVGAPGAGTLFAYGFEDLIEDDWDSLPRTHPRLTASPDSLLTHGIGDYTYLKAPEGILGRGKFSTVYRVVSSATTKHRSTTEGVSTTPILTSLNILPSAPAVVASVSTITATATRTTTVTTVTGSLEGSCSPSSSEPTSTDSSPSSTSIPTTSSSTSSTTTTTAPSPTKRFPSPDTTPLASGYTTPVQPHPHAPKDQKFFALKHTPLYPHHQLIAQRLLREPTLLAQLAPHPCLIGVDGFVRTEGHFYLVEDCASSHVPLPQHPYPLLPSRAAYLLDQLVSVVRDDLHAGRVCHRDLKGENILVNPDTGDILLLDLGLATHFSASEPKLTTCCGSPAFHSPEIVNALNHRPGEVTYYGPELDIWCIALTMLSLLTQTRFPLGPHHTSRTVMAQRASEVLAELDTLYPPSAPWRIMGQLSPSEQAHETSEWKRVRRAMHTFVNIRASHRMAAFKAYDVGAKVQARVDSYPKTRAFKTTAFTPAEVKYTIPLYLEPGEGPITMRNPTNEPEKRIVSYVKYLLRSAGILYHHVPGTHPPILQLVLPLEPEEPQPKTWVSQLFRRPGPVRSSSVPPPTHNNKKAQEKGQNKGKKEEWHQQVWLRIEVKRGRSRSRHGSRAPSATGSRAPSRAHSRAPSRAPSGGGSRATSQAPSRAPSQAGASRSGSRAPSDQGSRTPSLSGTDRVDRRVTIDLAPLHGALMSSGRRRASSSGSSRVVLTLTEPRGYPLLRSALSAAKPPSESELRQEQERSSVSSTGTCALEIPRSGSEDSHGGRNGEEDEEGEGERGRPRSKESHERASSSTTPRRLSKLSKSPHQLRSVAVGSVGSGSTAIVGSVSTVTGSLAGRCDSDRKGEGHGEADGRGRAGEGPSALLESVFGRETVEHLTNEAHDEYAYDMEYDAKRSRSLPPGKTRQHH